MKAEKLHERFHCQSLSDHYEMYLKLEILLLVCLVKEIRKRFHRTFGISLPASDCQVMLFSDFAKQANNFRHTVNIIESERQESRWWSFNHFESFVYSKKSVWKAHHSKGIKFLLLLDTNNLYCALIEKLILPCKDYSKVQTPLGRSPKTSNQSNVTEVLDVELDNPDYSQNLEKFFLYN